MSEAKLRNRKSQPAAGKIVTERNLRDNECEDEDADERSACYSQQNCPWLFSVVRVLANIALVLAGLSTLLRLSNWWLMLQDGKGFVVRWPSVPWPPPGLPESVEERLQAVQVLESHIVNSCGGAVHASMEFFMRLDGSIGGRIRDGLDVPWEGEPMLQVAMRCVMSDFSARLSPHLGPLLGEGPGFGSLEDRLTFEGEQELDIAGWALVVHLAIELMLGANSNFWPYLRTLPRRPSVPLLWDKSSLRLLAGTGLDVYNEERLRPALVELHAKLFGNGSPFTGLGLDLDLFVTAYALVRSRSFVSAGRSMMVPLLDLINHNQHFPADPWVSSHWELFDTDISIFLKESVVPVGNRELGYDYWHGAEILSSINLQLHGFVHEAMTPLLALDVRDLSPRPNSSQWFSEVAEDGAGAPDYTHLAGMSLFWMKAGIWPDGHESTAYSEDVGQVFQLLCFLRLHALQVSGRRPDSIREQGRPGCSAPSVEWCRLDPELESVALRFFSDILQATRLKLAEAAAEQLLSNSSEPARLKAAKTLNSMVSTLHARVSSGIQAAATTCNV